MFRSVENRYFQSQNRIAKCLHLWHFWFVLSNPEDEHGWPPREFFMVDGIGSPHCADIATVGHYRQFPWEQWTANGVRGGFPSQYDTNHIGQWRKWLRKKARSRRTQESSAQWNENDWLRSKMLGSMPEAWHLCRQCVHRRQAVLRTRWGSLIHQALVRPIKFGERFRGSFPKHDIGMTGAA